jgi:hypothetical protein
MQRMIDPLRSARRAKSAAAAYPSDTLDESSGHRGCTVLVPGHQPLITQPSSTLFTLALSIGINIAAMAGGPVVVSVQPTLGLSRSGVTPSFAHRVPRARAAQLMTFRTGAPIKDGRGQQHCPENNDDTDEHHTTESAHCPSPVSVNWRRATSRSTND